MGWQPPSEDEFNNWVTVDDALGLLVDITEPWHKRRWLMERLKAGLIIGVARTGQPSEREPKISAFVHISQRLWQMWRDSGDEHFWETNGENAIFDHYGSTGASGGSTPQRFFDVRFDPKTFSGKPPIAPPDAPDTKPEGAKDLPAVKRRDLDRWHEVFKATHPNAPEALAMRSAAAMFPDNRIPRQWVRELRGPQPIGKPKTRHD